MTSQLGLEEYIRFSWEEGALKEKEQHTEQGSFTKGGWKADALSGYVFVLYHAGTEGKAESLKKEMTWLFFQLTY